MYTLDTNVVDFFPYLDTSTNDQLPHKLLCYTHTHTHTHEYTTGYHVQIPTTYGKKIHKKGAFLVKVVNRSYNIHAMRIRKISWIIHCIQLTMVVIIMKINPEIFYKPKTNVSISY